MEEKLSLLKEEVEKEMKNVQTTTDVENIRVEYLGKKGKVIEILKNLKNVEASKRKEVGQQANKLREEIEILVEQKKQELKEKEYETKIKNAKKIDITVPVEDKVGSLHPITIVQKELEDIFTGMGFTVEDGNEVETEYNNFEAVNVPKYHPARDMQDTFWLENGELSNLIYFMKTLLSEVFKKDVEVRLRPGYFPFVEPGFELDIKCPYCDGKGCKVCKNGSWIELCPCGMIHPNVLRMGGIDPEEYSGFAFGLGLSRLAMMKYNIDDLRALNSCDLRILKQMKIK